MRNARWGLRSMWELLNEPRENADLTEYGSRPIWDLFRRYYLRRHWPSMTVALVAAAMTGIWVFVHTTAGRIIVDDIVQVQLQSQAAAPGTTLDPTLPGEKRTFVLDEAHDRQGLDTRIGAKQGKSVDEKMRLLTWVALMMIGNEVLRHLMSLVMIERTVYAGQMVNFRLRQHLHDKLHQLPLSYHDRHSPGRLMTHLFSDVGHIQQNLNELIRQVPPYIVNIALGLVIVLMIQWRLALLVLAALPAYWGAYRWFKRRLKTVNINLREREGRLNGHIANRISSFQVVKSFVREGTESLDFLRRNRPIIRNHLSASMLNTGFGVVCSLITGTCTTLVLWLGALQVRDGKLSLGQLLMFWGAAGQLFAPIAGLTNTAGMLHRLRVLCGRVMRVLNEPVTLADPEEPMPVPTRACEIRVEHVTMKYDADRPAAIDDVSFVLPAGRKLCIMGPSGGGKSTLAKLLCRLYDPSEGEILFDGVNVRQFLTADLRKVVGFVSQEPIVFRGTIADNIRYGSEDSSDQAVVAAAQYAQIHDFIDCLPERYSTLTHERGLTLSGGQKQRVNLARALLYNPIVMVLDDCTSALDADTEARLVESFQTALRGRTAVLVSHRVSIAMGCDLVLVLAKGKAVEFGPPRELLEQDGAFAELQREQFRKGNEMVAAGQFEALERGVPRAEPLAGVVA